MGLFYLYIACMEEKNKQVLSGEPNREDRKGVIRKRFELIGGRAFIIIGVMSLMIIAVLACWVMTVIPFRYGTYILCFIPGLIIGYFLGINKQKK